MTASFRDLGVSRAVVDALATRGVTAPFPVQALVMKDVLRGADVLAKSETGSGKTLAFAIPIAETLDPAAEKRPAALILMLSRELAVQVRDGIVSLACVKEMTLGLVLSVPIA